MKNLRVNEIKLQNFPSRQESLFSNLKNSFLRKSNDKGRELRKKYRLGSRDRTFDSSYSSNISCDDRVKLWVKMASEIESERYISNHSGGLTNQSSDEAYMSSSVCSSERSSTIVSDSSYTDNDSTESGSQHSDSQGHGFADDDLWRFCRK